MTPGQRELDFGWEVWATPLQSQYWHTGLGQSEQSYLEKWPSGIKISLSQLHMDSRQPGLGSESVSIPVP